MAESPAEREARWQPWLVRHIREQAEKAVLERHADEVEEVIAKSYEQREAEKKAQWEAEKEAQ